jgi:hypothetical protein
VIEDIECQFLILNHLLLWYSLYLIIIKARNIMWVEGIKLCDFYATKIFKLCEFLSKLCDFWGIYATFMLLIFQKLCDFMWLSKSQSGQKLEMNSKVYFKYVYNKELFAKPHWSKNEYSSENSHRLQYIKIRSLWPTNSYRLGRSNLSYRSDHF